MKIKKKNLFIFFLLLFLFVLGASFVLAQDKELEVKYPGVPEAEAPTAKTVLPDYVKYIFNLSIIIGGLVAFGVFILGGAKHLTSAGDPTKMSDAKDQIFAGFLGLIILLSSYLILTTINPQLVIVSLPPLEKIEIPKVPELPRPEKPTLTASEIPMGKLIDGVGKEVSGGSATSPLYEYEGVIAKTRLVRIKNLSEETWKTSKEIQEISEDIEKASEEIKILTDQCKCVYCCDQCHSCPGCYCEQDDPCHNRPEIIKEQGELRKLTPKLLPLKIKLEELEKKLKTEKEKLESSLAELEKGEEMMKNCLYSLSEGGRPNSLLSFDSFWIYKQDLENEEIKLIKEVKIEEPWKNVSGGDDSATFYCTEGLLDVSLSKIDIPEITEAAGMEEKGEAKIVCEIEIPFGRIIDNAKDIAQRLVDESQKILDEKLAEETAKEKENGEYMTVLPDNCRCSGCGCGCGKCCRCCNGCCCSCSPSCGGFPCLPPGEISATLKKIIENHCKIDSAFENITVHDDEIHNLIEGDEIHNADLTNSKRKPTWAYNIIDKELLLIRERFGRCIVPSSDWEAYSRGEKVLIKEVWSCDLVKSAFPQKKLIKTGDLSDETGKCALPKCVPLAKCSNSWGGALKNCTPVSEVFPEYLSSCESGECVISEEPKKYFSSCEPGLFYLSKKDTCEQNYFCCNELNFFCCETD